jgi:hypothetical protein
MEDDGYFDGHLVHFMVFCYILLTFGIVRGDLVYLFPFWYLVPIKIWQPWSKRQKKFKRIFFGTQAKSFARSLNTFPVHKSHFYIDMYVDLSM